MAHPINRRVTPNFFNIMEEDLTKLVSLASAVTSVVGGILGGALIINSAVDSLPMIAGIGSTYFCYNTFCMSRNLEKLRRNPQIFLNRVALVNELSRNTVLFRWFVSSTVDFNFQS